jgi:predicted phosphodiesterase
MNLSPVLYLLLIHAPLSMGGILMGPYLQALTPTSVYVLVETDSPGDITVEYGTTPELGLSAGTESVALTTAWPVTYVHRIPLRDLSPETEYYYRAGEGNLFSEVSHFRSGALPGTPFRFVWIADDRSGPEVFDSVVVHAGAAHPLLALYGGDLCTRPGYDDWKNGFFRPLQVRLGETIPWVNTPGNHEKWTTNTQAFTHGPVGSALPEYFSFDCGDMHVLVLNNEISLAPCSPQYLYADADIRGTRREWKIVMAHKPAYCAGGHGEDSAMIALTTGVFEPAGVDVVLSGHSHFYQHNVVNGIHHIVIGSAGAPLYDPAKAWYTVKSLKEYTWAAADVTPDALSLFVYDEHGAPLDTLLLTKQHLSTH